MKKMPSLAQTSDEFSSISSDDSDENDENLEKVGLDILRLPSGEFRRPKHFTASSDSSEDEATPELNRLGELKRNAKAIKLGCSKKFDGRRSPARNERFLGDEDHESSDSSGLAVLDESKIPEDLKKWTDVAMYPEHVVDRLIQYTPRESSEDVSDLDMVVTKPMFFPSSELKGKGGNGMKSHERDYEFCKPGCYVGKASDQTELILQMDQEAMIQELRREMKAVGIENCKRYFSSDYFTETFEKQILEAGINGGSDSEDNDGQNNSPHQQTPRVDQESAAESACEAPIAEATRRATKSTVSSFKSVETWGGKSKKVTESLLRSSTEKESQSKSASPLILSESDLTTFEEETRDKISEMPAESSAEESSRSLLEEDDDEEEVGREEAVKEEFKENLVDQSKKLPSQSCEKKLTSLEKAWLMFLKVNLKGLDKRQVRIKPVKSNMRQQFKGEKKPGETGILSSHLNAPELQPDEVYRSEANNLKIENQFKDVKEGEIHESLVDFGLDEEFVDILKKIPTQRPSLEKSTPEQEVESSHSDSSLINSDEMDEINAKFTKNVIVTPDTNIVNKLVDIPYYLVPPDVRAPIQVGTSLQEAQEKMFASMGQNYFSTRIVYAFEFDPKKLSQENLALAFRDYVISQNAGFRDIGSTAGCLFTYESSSQGIVMIEGGEYQITRHFADLKATEIYIALKKSRILFVHTYIQEQYLKKWVFVNTSPPAGTDINLALYTQEESKAKEMVLLLTEKLNILFHHLEQREKTINTNFSEIDLPTEIHLKLPPTLLIDCILDYYALRPLHKFIEEIYSVPDTYDSSEDEQIFPEDIPYYAIQPGKHELSDILDYMVEDKTLVRKKQLEREVRKKVEADGKPYKRRLDEDEHEVQLMYDIDDLLSVKQLDVETIYVEKFDETAKAKLKRTPYGKDLEGYERIRRFKSKPELIKSVKKRTKKKKKVKEEIKEEEEKMVEETEDERLLSETSDKGPEMVDEQKGRLALQEERETEDRTEPKDETEPKEKQEPLEEMFGEMEEDKGKGRKSYKKLFKVHPEYKVPYREVGPTQSESTDTHSTATSLGLGEEEEFEPSEYDEQLREELTELDEMSELQEE